MPKTVRAAETGSLEFGTRLRALRRARGLRQQDLADGAYSAAYISMLESGRTRASMKALEHISIRLGVEVAELLGGGPQPNEVEAGLAVAKALLAANNVDGSLEALAAIDDATTTPRQQLAKLRLQGRAFVQLRRAKEAMPPLQKGLVLAQRLADKAEIAHVRYALGTCCYYTFAYREALQHHLAALEAIQRGEVRDALLEFRVMSALGNDHAALGEQSAAIGYYERALAMSGDVVDQERLGGVHAGLAFAFAKQQDYEAAIRHARESLTLYEQIGAKRTVPEVMNNLALLYAKVGNRLRADELLQQAIESARATDNRFVIPHLILSRAELFARTEPSRARELGREALDAAEAFEQREGILSARVFMATLESDPARARPAFEQCLALARSAAPGHVRRVLEAWSEWEEAHGDARRAAKLAREALHT